MCFKVCLTKWCRGVWRVAGCVVGFVSWERFSQFLCLASLLSLHVQLLKFPVARERGCFHSVQVFLAGVFALPWGAGRGCSLLEAAPGASQGMEVLERQRTKPNTIWAHWGLWQGARMEWNSFKEHRANPNRSRAGDKPGFGVCSLLALPSNQGAGYCITGIPLV